MSLWLQAAARRKFVSITMNNKRTVLAVTRRRRKERKQFSAHSLRMHILTQLGSKAPFDRLPFTSGLPRQRTSSGQVAMSQRCQQLNYLVS
jgi:hypothetical protein